MTALFRSELRKVTATRLALGLLLGALAIVGLALGVTLWGPTTPGVGPVEGVPQSLTTSGDLLSYLGIAGTVTLFALLFGVTFATSEYRHHTVATTYLHEPRRWRVNAAKAVLAVAVAVFYAVTVLALALGMTWIFAMSEGTTLPLDGDVWTYMAMLVAATAVIAVLGVGVGFAIRSQVGAIVTVLVWLFVVESLLGGLVPSIAKWTPFAAGTAMTVPSAQMSATMASAVAVGYAVLATVAGVWLAEHRDAV